MVKIIRQFCEVKLLKDQGDKLVVRSPEKVALCHFPSQRNQLGEIALGKKGVPAANKSAGTSGAQLKMMIVRFQVSLAPGRFRRILLKAGMTKRTSTPQEVPKLGAAKD